MNVTSPLRRQRTRSRGYTVVEVLSAMTLFAIGAAGVISMQRVTIQGGTDARRFDVGANLANEWTYRLQRDSMFWTQPNSANPTTSNLNNTRWLRLVPASPPPPWVTPDIPSTNEQGISPAFDVFGRDLKSTATAADGLMYCTQIRLQWIADPGAQMLPGALMRAEVRVFWPRLDAPELTTCANVAPEPANNFHVVYATTVIRQNPDR